MEFIRRFKWILTLGTFLGIPFALVLADTGAPQEAVTAWILPWIFGALSLHSLLSFVQIQASGQAQRNLADLSEFSQHQTHTVASLEEVFRHESPDSSLELKSKLFGVPQASQLITAPLSGKKVLAYRLRADLLKKRQKPDPDFLNLELDQGWTEMNLGGDKKELGIKGPGILDSAGWEQKTLTVSALKSAYPGLSKALEQRLALDNKKISSFSGVRLTEVSLAPQEDVFVYGRVRKTSQGLFLFGSAVPEDPEGLLLRSSHTPASSRSRGLSPWPWLGAGLGFLLVGVLLAATGPLAFLWETGKGGVKVLKSDHSLFTLTLTPQSPRDAEDSNWTLSSLFEGEEGVLSVDEVPIRVNDQTIVTLEGWRTRQERPVFPGGVGGPRWSKGLWVWSLKTLEEPEEGPGFPLTLVNQTESPLTLDLLLPDGTFLWKSRFLDPGAQVTADNVPEGAWIWGEGSKGRRLSLGLPDGGPEDMRILDLLPSDLTLPRRGPVEFSNMLAHPVQVFLVPAHPGDDPVYWDFFSGEGPKTLTLDDQDYLFSGTGTLGVRILEPLGRWEGPLSRVAQWDDRENRWILTLNQDWTPPK